MCWEKIMQESIVRNMSFIHLKAKNLISDTVIYPPAPVGNTDVFGLIIL